MQFIKITNADNRHGLPLGAVGVRTPEGGPAWVRVMMLRPRRRAYYLSERDIVDVERPTDLTTEEVVVVDNTNWGI